MASSLTIPETATATPHASFNFADALSAIFKHKGKIIICLILGLVAAGAVYFFYPPQYESSAKLLVRYVLDRSPVDPVDGGSSSTTGFGKTTDNVINSEVEILKSWDLAVQVAEAIGFRKLVPEMGDAANATAAATVVNAGLEVASQKGSDILFVSYTSRDPQLATVVLDELVNRYFVKHLEVHRSAAAFDFVSRQSDQVRARLTQTEDALKALKAKAGISSSADNSGTLNADIVKIEDQYLGSEAELAEQSARVKQVEESLGAGSTAASQSSKSKNTGANDSRPLATSDELQRYKALTAKLEKLRQNDLDLLSRYTAESDFVKLNRAEIQKLETEKRDLEKKWPDLVTQSASATGAQSGPLDLSFERARLAGTKAKTEMLKARLDERVKQLSEVGSQIADLERKKELEETNYKYFEGAVEKARIDEALDPSKMPNISAVQRPSPPLLVSGKRNKIVLMLAGGGLALGIAFALIAELFLNQTIKRPLELETQLRAPLLLTIPFTRANGRSPLSRKKRLQNSDNDPDRSAVAPWEAEHFIRPYSEAIRDRLGLYFKLNGMTHKPKLVGVTGFSDGAGSSTLSAGLAAALSEMGDGKVLLVDVNVGSEEVHPFFKGKSAHLLTTALEPSAAIDSAADGLYLATVSRPSETPMPLALKKFFDLMPNLKASDFDYIIFDMPALHQTSPTLSMAGFMDKILVVVEAEKSNRDSVRRGYAELIAARANVSVVLNKTRSYVPKWLDTGS